MTKRKKDYPAEFARKGGLARAKALTAEEQSEIGRAAAFARWAYTTSEERKKFARKISRAQKARLAKARKGK